MFYEPESRDSPHAKAADILMLEAPSLQNDETPVSATFVLGFSFMICSLRLSKLGFKLTIELRVTVTF